jgi:hypothetical protein
MLELATDVFSEVFQILNIKMAGNNNLILAIISLMHANLYDRVKFHKQFNLPTVRDMYLRARIRNQIEAMKTHRSA